MKKYDVVKIEGVTGSISDTFNQDMAIWDKKDDFIIVTALLTNNTTQTGVITLKRSVRIWIMCVKVITVYGGVLRRNMKFTAVSREI